MRGMEVNDETILGEVIKRDRQDKNREIAPLALAPDALIIDTTDLDIEAKEILRLRTRLYEILAKHSGQSAEKIEKDCDRNLWLEAAEAIEYGLADRILQKAPEIVREQTNEDEQEEQ